MTAYSKLIAAVVAALFSAAAPVVLGGHVTTVAVINIVLAGLSAALVYESANVPGLAPYAKAVMAGLTAAATLLATLIGSGSPSAVTPAEWVQILIAFASTVLVYLAKNRPTPDQLRALAR